MIEIKQPTGIKQSQIKQPNQSDDALSEPETMHGKGHAISLAQLPKWDPPSLLATFQAIDKFPCEVFSYITDSLIHSLCTSELILWSHNGVHLQELKNTSAGTSTRPLVLS